MANDYTTYTFIADPGFKSGSYCVCADGLEHIELYNLDSLTDFIDHVQEYVSAHKGLVRAVLENVPVFCGKNTPSYTIFKLARNFGFLEGTFRALMVPIEYYSPQKWQKQIPGLKGLTGQPRKRAIREFASTLYPLLKPTIRQADSLMIAHHHFNR
jgi:hypothetical protein